MGWLVSDKRSSGNQLDIALEVWLLPVTICEAPRATLRLGQISPPLPGLALR